MTKIEWTDATWNPVRGCSRVSPGCQHCYAERMARRSDRPGGAYEGLTVLAHDGPRWNGKVRLVPEKLDEPLRWRKPRMVFVNSMSDLFHEDIPNEFIAAVFGVMAASPQHTFQVLTKRAERMRDWFQWVKQEAGDCNPSVADTACIIEAQRATESTLGGQLGPLVTYEPMTLHHPKGGDPTEWPEDMRVRDWPAT